MRGTIYLRHDGYLQLLRICIDGKVHLGITGERGELGLHTVRRCDGSCVRGEMEIPQEFHAEIAKLLETGEVFPQRRGRNYTALRVPKATAGTE